MVKIEYCEFDDTALYDLENLIWIKRIDARRVRVGITSMLAYLAGKLTRVSIKPVGTRVEKGKSIASIESLKYFNVVRSPFNASIVEVNGNAIKRPKMVNDYPYTDGWIAVLEINDANEINNLKPLNACIDELASKIRDMHIRCFSAFPDYEMFEIGVECAAVLPKLNELVSRIDKGEVIHIVSDDPTSDVEMIRWSEEKGQELLEIRKEGSLMHFIVRKLR